MSSPCGFLEGLPVTVRSKLEQLARPHAFAPGAVLFQEGTTCDDVHLLMEGHVRIEMLVPERGRLTIMTLGGGDLLGWTPFFGDHPMTATAIAMESVKTLALDGQDLRNLCDSDHEVGYHVMRQVALVLSRRLLATRLHLLDLFQDHRPAHPPLAEDSEC